MAISASISAKRNISESAGAGVWQQYQRRNGGWHGGKRNKSIANNNGNNNSLLSQRKRCFSAISVAANIMKAKMWAKYQCES
jgi:hypothetical protein